MSGSWGAREAGQKPGERAENVATRREILAYAVPPNWDSPPLPRLEEQVRKDLGELGTEVVTVVTRARQLANLNFSNLLDHKNRDRNPTPGTAGRPKNHCLASFFANLPGSPPCCPP